MLPSLLPLAFLAALGACDDAPDATRGMVTSPSSGTNPVAPPVSTNAPRVSGTAPTPPAPPPITLAGSSGAPAQALPTDTARLPLARVLQIARKAVPGEVIDVELDEDDDIPEYEVKILTPTGRSMEIKIDALRGAILEMEED